MARCASIVEEVGKSMDSPHMGERSADFSQVPPLRYGYLIHVGVDVLDGTATPLKSLKIKMYLLENLPSNELNNLRSNKHSGDFVQSWFYD